MQVGRISIIAGIILWCCSAVGKAQVDADGLVFFDALSFAGEEKGQARLDLYLSVPYAALDFSREAEGFVARYRAVMKVQGEGRTVLDTTFNRTVLTKDYDRTNGDREAFEFYQLSVPVTPGEYTASVEILDFGTNLLTRGKRTVAVIDFDSYSFSLSGLLLVSKIREEGESHAITPLLTENVSLLKDGYFLFYEAYNATDNNQFVVTARYLSSDDEVVWTKTWEKEIKPGHSQQWLRMPIEGIGRGSYIAEIVAARADSPDETIAAAKRVVSFRGTVEGLPLSEEELESKIKKLRYVADQRELDFIRDAVIFSEKRKRFAEFWADRDPSPGTPLNEAMDEYYRRIDHANKRFRSYAEGWLTDMGRVYIVYGPPDRVDRDPFSSDGKPRETWEYYGRRLQLVFVDQTGFDDFRLLTPVPLSEKYRY